MEVEIYSKTNCVFCDKAKMRLAKQSPKILMLDQDYNREDFFKKFPNARTFPQIIINGKNIGGYQELEKWLENNTFDTEF
jgi:glutaredoxin 3